MPDQISQIPNLVIAIAQKEVGNEEIPRGSNWGVNVQKYLASVGINFPASWCMAFVYWCFDEAYKSQNMQNPLVKTGGVMHAWEVTATGHRASPPQPGDIFIMDFGQGLGHTGIVVSVDGPNLHTIEGNTNDTGSREGFEVCQKVRHISGMKGFLRFS
jgi:hypothetical protein